MGVNDVGRERLACPFAHSKLRPEEAEQRDLRAEGRLDLGGHVPHVGQRLELARRVAEPIDGNVIETIGRREARRAGRHHARLDPLGAQRAREPEHEGAGGVAVGARE